ncbi:MAG: hypothetical protein ACK4NS_11835 [Saprospiraceae bacterium]
MFKNITLGPDFTTHTFEILIMLLGAFLLGLWLGWLLWSKYKKEAERLLLETQSLESANQILKEENDRFKQRLKDEEAQRLSLLNQRDEMAGSRQLLEAKHRAAMESLMEAEEKIRRLETELALAATKSTTPDVSAVQIAPLSAYEEEPPYAGADTSQAPVMETIEFDSGGENFAQEEFVVTDDMLNEASEEEDMPPAISEKSADLPPATAESPVVDAADINPELIEIEVVAPPFAAKRDDLKKIEGIGPKISELLNQYGIYTFEQLAKTEVRRLKEILSAAGPQLAMHDPGTWPSQANLAANGEWKNLEFFQEMLKGGKAPK